MEFEGAGAAHEQDGGRCGFVSEWTVDKLGSGLRTSVCDLAGVATGASVAVLGKGGANFTEGFKGGAVTRALIFG